MNLDELCPTAWIINNHLLNENQQPIEFTDHRFLIQPFDDMHNDIVVKKSAQVGFSVLAILKSFWLARYKGMNSIYVLPTQDIVKGFVNPKVDPLIATNECINSSIQKDSVTLKQVGNRFVHYKGSSSQREAISTSADVLVIDELDRCIDQNVLSTYDSRLQASKVAWRWRFSNPSAVNFGVDRLYNDSNQYHWIVDCAGCGWRSWLDFEPNPVDNNHYIERSKKIYACGKCGDNLTDDDRRNGEWVAKHPDRKRHGYWFSQLMAPWVTAERILEQYEESPIDFFYNFVLGKAYTPSNMLVNRENILRATAPSTIVRNPVVIGVDQNVSQCIWVACTPQGMFDHGKANSWEEIEHMKLMYNATVVCDPNPYSMMPKKMATKYSDWYMCYFKQMDGIDVVQWKGSVVYADRTRLLDIVATEIIEAKLMFRERPHAMEDYIKDWTNIYRTTTEKDDGRIRSEWIKKEGQLSDYPFAHAYARIGISRVLGGWSMIVEPEDTKKKAPVSTLVSHGDTITATLGDIVTQTFNSMGD